MRNHEISIPIPRHSANLDGSNMSTGNRFHFPVTLVFGITVIFVCEILLFIDVALREWAVAPYSELETPKGVVQSLGRSVSINLTPICWLAYLFAADGLLEQLYQARGSTDGLTRSPVRLRPKRFVFCFLASVPIWLWFDWVNFSFVDAWRYHGLPNDLVHRNLNYFFAFGAICPAMFLTAELYQRMGLYRLEGRPLRFGAPLQMILIGTGCAFLGFPFAVRDPIGSLTMWLGWFLLLDPINHWLGQPSIIGDWRTGRYGRTLALLMAGMSCGLLWEFWNYWAVAKWTYHLPFLGFLEQYRFFEIPAVGLLGFPLFAIECWTMFQTAAFVVSRLRHQLLEPLPSGKSII